MPATSRSGERLRRRSRIERAGSPSKSSSTQRPAARSVWPRWKSPWWRISRPPTPTCGHELQPVADLLAAPGDRRERLVVGRQVEEQPLDLLVDRGGDQRQRLVARVLRGEVRVGAVASRARGAARPVTSPSSRSWSSSAGRRRRAPARRRRAPSRRSRRATYSWTTPSVASMSSPEYAYQPASAAMCSKLVRGEEPQHLELGVVARLQAAEDLEHQALVEDERGVRLLHADRPHLRLEAERDRALHPVEARSCRARPATVAPCCSRTSSSRASAGSSSAS